MANKEIAIEYTEEKYTSRNEMSRSIGFQISDLMWKKVTDYRANFNHSISLKWFGSKNFALCVYPTFASKVNQVEGKINRIISQANALNKTNGDSQYFKVSCFKRLLKENAKTIGLTIDDGRLSKLISSENPFDQGEEKLLNYLSALEFIETKYVNNIDVDFLAELYSKVTGISELTYFYRDRNDVNVNSLSVVSRVYESAPCEYIEIMMDSLFDFIKNANISVIVKALIAYEYILIIKPFNDYNDEIAVLVAKAILAHFSYGEVAALFNLEVLNSYTKEAKRKINIEVQQNVDLTYALVEYIDSVDSSLSEVLTMLRDFSVKELRNDFYKTDEISEEPVEVQEKVEPLPQIKPARVLEETPAPTPASAPAPKIEPTPMPEPVKQEETIVPKGLAVDYIPPELDEKQASRLEQHLLEMDVRLKRGEAHFYARHCTLGMYYTIDQYKKTVKCVYETARTSMDHLAELGYYNKQQVGKKFVYSPIERK